MAPAVAGHDFAQSSSDAQLVTHVFGFVVLPELDEVLELDDVLLLFVVDDGIGAFEFPLELSPLLSPFSSLSLFDGVLPDEHATAMRVAPMTNA